MKGIARRRPRARQDLIDIFRYFAREASVATAQRFLSQAKITFEQLARMPSMGSKYEAVTESLENVRYFPIRRFKKYLVFYLPYDLGIDVLRVLHGARDIPSILADELGIDDGPR
jgi:toxin ParE1/3/4